MHKIKNTLRWLDLVNILKHSSLFRSQIQSNQTNSCWCQDKLWLEYPPPSSLNTHTLGYLKETSDRNFWFGAHKPTNHRSLPIRAQLYWPIRTQHQSELSEFQWIGKLGRNICCKTRTLSMFSGMYLPLSLMAAASSGFANFTGIKTVSSKFLCCYYCWRLGVSPTPRLRCCGAVLAHCDFHLLDSSDSPASQPPK